jgi:hypothetical protein
MKRILVILQILLWMNGLDVFGQSMPYLTLPAEQNVPIYDQFECTGLNIPNVPSGTPWIVFSDRDDNDVFSNRGLTGPITQVDLGKRFLVLSQSGNSLEVIEFRESEFTMSIATGTCTPKLQNPLRGWMSKDRLLLSQECLKVCNIDIPKAPLGFFPLRGLFVNSFGGNQFDNLYKTPGSTAVGNIKRKLDMTTIYGFVLKIITVNNIRWYLMAKDPSIENFVKAEDIILGWKPQSDVVFWKHQLSLEFNWSPAAAAEREKSNVRVKAWDLLANGSSPEIACNQAGYRGTTGYVIENPIYKQRESGDYMEYRYPILRVENVPGCTSDRAIIGKLNFQGYSDPNQMIKFSCGSFRRGEIIGDALSSINDFKYESQNINLVFVIDATASMLTGKKEQIFKSINGAVENVKSIIKGKQLVGVKLKIGALLYQDQHITHPAKVVEYIDLNENSTVVTDWINAHLVAENESPADFPEALFYALKKANEIFSGKNRIFQSNYFILLGDHGSHQRMKDSTYVAMNDLKEKINCSLDDYIIFQHSRVSGGNKDKVAASQLYQSQMNDLITALGKRNQEGDTIINNGNMYTKRSLKGEGSYFIYPNDNQELTGEVLAQEIERVILNTVPLLEKKIYTLSNMVYAQRNDLVKSCIYDDLRAFICSNPKYNKYCKCEDALQEYFKVLIQIFTGMRNSEFATTNTSDLKPFFTKHAALFENLSDGNNKLFNVVISSPKNQLERIDQFVSIILGGGGGKGPRNAILDAWYRILINELRFVRNTQQANLIKLQDAHSLLTGYPGITRYGDLTIGDILTGSKFTAAMVDEYVVDWIITLGYLRSVTSKRFAITGQYLTTYLGSINAVRVAHKKPQLLPKDMNALASRFQVSDMRATPVYFQNYPNRRTDLKRNIVSYYLETTIFPTQSSNFIDIICNY